MPLPKFAKGQTLTADDLNALAAEIDAVRKIAESATLRDVSGATFSRDAAGTTLSVPLTVRRCDADEKPDDGDGGSVRRLFRWSSNKRETTESAGDLAAPTHDIEVSSGLVLLRPHQLSGAGAGATALDLHPQRVKFSDISASIRKKTFRAQPKLSSCEGIEVIRSLTTSTEGAGVAEITTPVTVPVPSYRLQSAASAEVVTGWRSSTSPQDAQVTIPPLTSSTEFMTDGSVLLNLRMETLSATPNNGPSWTRTLVIANGTSASFEPRLAPVTLPETRTTARVNVPAYSFTTTYLPTGWRLEPTSTENVTRDATFRIGVEKFTMPAPWEGVDIIEEDADGTELVSLTTPDAEGGMEASLAGRVPDGDAAALLSGRVPDDAEEPPATLHRVPGADFSFTGKELLICLNVAVSSGEAQFFWTEHEIPAEDAAAEELTDDDVPQRATARILGVLEEKPSGAIAFGVAAGAGDAFDGMANWRARVPMAAVWKGEDGAPEIEPLTHGCVEISPRLRLCIRGGGAVCEGIAAAAPARLSAFPELEADDLAFLEAS